MKPLLRFPRLAAGATLGAILLLAACGRGGPTDTGSPAASGSAPAAPATTPAPMPPASTAPAMGAPAAPMSAPAPAGSAPTVSANAAGLQVADLTLGDAVGKGYAIDKPTREFAPGQATIYASVRTTGQTDGATLSARFSYLEGKGQEVSRISQTIATDGPAVTTFQVHNPDDWPQGRYKVEIALDGKPVTSETFEVKGA